MELKLRARLTAYSKLDVNSNNSSAILPIPESSDAGSVVGVGKEGSYELFPTVTESEIDSLFDPQTKPTSVTKDEIDTLFSENDVTKQDIDSLFAR